jgi:hypothetical protein
MNHTASGRHPVDGARFDALDGAEIVPVQHRAFEEISDRREADVGMGTHIMIVTRSRRQRPEVIEKNKWADALLRMRWQQPAHREAAADILVARR